MSLIQTAVSAGRQQENSPDCAELKLGHRKGAGVTPSSGSRTRTGRYFLNQREVLFDGQAVLISALTGSLADEPGELGPLDTLFRAFRSIISALEANRPFSHPRQEVIAASPALRERELAKQEALGDALAGALRGRNVPEVQAVLAARAGVAAFAYTTLAWLGDPAPGLRERLDLAYEAMTAIL